MLFRSKVVDPVLSGVDVSINVTANFQQFSLNVNGVDGKIINFRGFLQRTGLSL